MARNFLNYVNFSYQGGQNDTDKSDQLLENQGELMQNVYIREKGAIEKRSGTSLIGSDQGNTAIVGLSNWQEDDGTKWLFSVSGSTLYYLNGASWSALKDDFTANLDMEFEIANNNVYVTNGTDNVKAWDGASVALNSGFLDVSAGVPTGNYLRWWKNYMFLTGETASAGTSYPSRVWFSNLGDAGTWTIATDHFDVNTSDGQKITGIGILEDFLIIFKENSIWAMQGAFPDEWIIDSANNNLTNIFQGVGCVSHRSIVQVGNDLWFMSKDGIRSLRRNAEGTTPLMGRVDGNLQTTIESLNESQLSGVVATLFDKRVYFAIPTGSSTFNNKILVADTTITLENPINPHPWVTYTGWSPSCWTVYEPSNTSQLYFGEGDADGVVYQAETGTNDNSAAIDYDYKSPMIDLRAPDMRKTARFLYAGGQVAGDYDVEISSSEDGNTFRDHGDLNLSNEPLWNSATFDTDLWGYAGEKRDKFVLNRAGKKHQIRFRNNTADETIKMYPWTLAIKVKQVK